MKGTNMATMPDPQQYIQARGVTMDRRLDAAFSVAEHRLGYPLTVIKAHDPANSAVSADTHKGTGVADLSPFDAARKMRVLEDIGFAPFHRTPADGFPEHLHVVLRGTGHGLDPSAQRQVTSWLSGHNGLANNALDRDTYRPNPMPEPFNYSAWWHAGQRRLKRVELRNRLKAINEKISALRTRRAMIKAKLVKLK